MSSTARRRLIRLLVLLLVTLLLWYLLHVLLPGLLGPEPGPNYNLQTRKEETTMKTDCPFLEPLRRPQAGSTHGCAAAINFYPVGKDQERCEVCSVASLKRLPDCGHLDAYAWLEGYPGGAPFVRVEMFCGLTGDPLPNLLHCACCLERLPKAAGLFRPAMALVAAG